MHAHVYTRVVDMSGGLTLIIGGSEGCVGGEGRQWEGGGGVIIANDGSEERQCNTMQFVEIAFTL